MRKILTAVLALIVAAGPKITLAQPAPPSPRDGAIKRVKDAVNDCVKRSESQQQCRKCEELCNVWDTVPNPPGQEDDRCTRTNTEEKGRCKGEVDSHCKDKPEGPRGPVRPVEQPGQVRPVAPGKASW